MDDRRGSFSDFLSASAAAVTDAAASVQSSTAGLVNSAVDAMSSEQPLTDLAATAGTVAPTANVPAASTPSTRNSPMGFGADADQSSSSSAAVEMTMTENPSLEMTPQQPPAKKEPATAAQKVLLKSKSHFGERALEHDDLDLVETSRAGKAQPKDGLLKLSRMREVLLTDETGTIQSPIVWAATREPFIAYLRAGNGLYGGVRASALGVGAALAFG
jgi:hypothetical protein